MANGSDWPPKAGRRPVGLQVAAAVGCALVLAILLAMAVLSWLGHTT